MGFESTVSEAKPTKVKSPRQELKEETCDVWKNSVENQDIMDDSYTLVEDSFSGSSFGSTSMAEFKAGDYDSVINRGGQRSSNSLNCISGYPNHQVPSLGVTQNDPAIHNASTTTQLKPKSAWPGFTCDENHAHNPEIKSQNYLNHSDTMMKQNVGSPCNLLSQSRKTLHPNQVAQISKDNTQNKNQKFNLGNFILNYSSASQSEHFSILSGTDAKEIPVVRS